MAGISKALEFPAEVVFQRVSNSAEATALLQLSATAQRVEMIARFLLQQQQVPQAHHELQLQLNHALQQLFQLSYTLQAHAEQNSAHSQQLQLQTGVTSKVAERLMLAHCEQELAQRARIVSETRATVQLPPFAQAMQQISDHVRQRCLAAATLQAPPSWPVYQGQLQHSGHITQAAASPFTLANHQAGMSTSPDAGSGKSSLPAALDMLGASPELVLSEGSFRFQANTHAGAGLQPGVLFTPVLRSRANEEPSVSGRQAPLVSEQDMTEDKAPQGISSAFGTPIAPAPAGPSEYLGDHAVIGAEVDQFGNTSLAATAQRKHQSGPGTDAARWPANAEQGANKAHDASQPSTSSLKRVPETPDSSESRSQPTQSPCGRERSDTSPRQAGPLRVVLVNNSDEQAGTQGVNVAAFLLMDSQKDSTSPGHPNPAQPLSVLSQGIEGTAAQQLAVCNSQTQQPPLARTAAPLVPAAQAGPINHKGSGQSLPQLHAHQSESVQQFVHPEGTGQRPKKTDQQHGLQQQAAAGKQAEGSSAIVEASAGQDDSQGQLGALRLDLSSEEDPLLCTQRMPPSQGGSGSGQGLFKTPDNPPPDPKAQAPAQVAPQGPLSTLSPWNTPALAQPAPPNPPNSTQCWKLAGSVSPIAGHPAPALSWVGSHDAGPATGAASKDHSDGKSNKRKRSRSETNVLLANAAAELKTSVQPCQ
ncbi:hypothetical protein WJX82_000828 [Trebouxia sp. C0006]